MAATVAWALHASAGVCGRGACEVCVCVCGGVPPSPPRGVTRVRHKLRPAVFERSLGPSSEASSDDSCPGAALEDHGSSAAYTIRHNTFDESLC